MPMIAYCDNCKSRTERNVATDGLTSTREGLVVHTKVRKSNSGENPIICERCVRLAVQYAAGETAA